MKYLRYPVGENTIHRSLFLGCWPGTSVVLDTTTLGIHLRTIQVLPCRAVGQALTDNLIARNTEIRSNRNPTARNSGAESEVR